VRGAAGPVEWLTFPAPDDPQHQFRVNVSFLLSNYECIFGRGCPGLLNRGIHPDVACCERGVTFIDDEDFAHVADMVDELAAEDCDNIAHVRRRGWYQSSSSGRPYKTLNFSSEQPIEPGGRSTTIVSAFTADAWGGTDDHEDPLGRGHMGYWCIDTPDAYRSAQPVYRSMEYELRKEMGDAAYERLAELLDGIDHPRHPMPGQLVNGRRPMIPLLVEQRFPSP
jgi:hypothetical protein